jgi:soluble lytic murein transglycosylase
MAKGSRAAELTYLIADSFQDEAAALPSLADSAAVWFRMLVDRFPRAELAPRALVRLAHLRFSRSEWVAADSLFREYLARYPRGEDARAARYWGARSTLAAGRPDEARQLFGELLDTTPPDYYALLARRRMGGAGDVAVEELFRGGARAFDQSVAPEAADTLLPAGGPGSRELARARALLLVGEVAAAQLEIDEAVRLSGKSREELSRVARWALAWDYPESAFRVGAALLESEDEEQTARLAYPAAFPGYVMLEGLEAGLPPALLWAIVRQESSFDPAARSPVGAAGLLQLMPATARAEVARLGLACFETSDLDRPESNLHLGAAHLRDLVDRLDGDRVAAIAAYNAGASLASRWRSFPEASDTEAFIERIPFRETRRYVKAVIANQAQYEELYARR